MKSKSKYAGITGVVFGMVLGLCLFPDIALAQTPVTWSPEKPINGAPCVFRYRSPIPLKSLSGTFLGKRVFFAFDPASSVWYALAGIDYDTKPGSYDLALNGIGTNGQKLSFAQVVPVEEGFYRTSALSVPKKYVEPDPADLTRILQERDLKNELFSKVSSSQLWMGHFAVPAATGTSSEFGSQRTYNGKRQSVHQGLDYRAATGTAMESLAQQGFTPVLLVPRELRLAFRRLIERSLPNLVVLAFSEISAGTPVQAHGLVEPAA